MNTATLSATIDTVDKEQFVEKFTPLVKRIAHHMMARLPASVQVDDLIQAGMIGLLDAIKRYEGSHGRQFEIMQPNVSAVLFWTNYGRLTGCLVVLERKCDKLKWRSGP